MQGYTNLVVLFQPSTKLLSRCEFEVCASDVPFRCWNNPLYSGCKNTYKQCKNSRFQQRSQMME